MSDSGGESPEAGMSRDRLSEAELQAGLTRLGRDLAVPPIDPDAVLSCIRGLSGTATATSSGTAAPKSSSQVRIPRRMLVLAALLMTMTLATAVAATRGIPGITLRSDPAGTAEFDSSATLAEDALVQDSEWLGREVTLKEARTRAPFTVLTPGGNARGTPAVHISDDDSRVSLLYAATSSLPALGDSGVGAVITQFRGDTTPEALAKTLEPDAVKRVTVRGGSGIWIADPHPVVTGGSDSGSTSLRRIANGSTLLFTDARVTFRIQSALPLTAVLTIAESLE